jgi:hypothetical protein
MQGDTIVYSWGLNSSGQLSQPKKVVVTKPAPVTLTKDAVDVVELACGDLHSFVRTGAAARACRASRRSPQRSG